MPESGLSTAKDRPARRWLGVVRTVVAFAVAVLGAAVVVTGVTLQWLQESVMQRDGFAQVSQELVQDESLQDELVDTAVEQASGAIQQQELGGLPFSGVIKDVADRRVSTYIRDYAASDQYVEDWNQVLLRTFELNIEPAGSLPETSGDGAPEDLQLYVAPVVDSISTTIEDRLEELTGIRLNLDLGDQEALGGPDGILVVGDSATGPVLNTMADMTVQAPLFFWGGLVALALAAVLARHREWVLVGGGLGAALTTVIVNRGADRTTDAVLNSPDLQDVGRSVVQRVFEILLSGLDTTLSPWLWAGVMVAVLGVLLAAARWLWGAGSAGGSESGHTPSAELRRRRVVEV